MSALPQGVWYNQNQPLFYPLGVSTVNVKNIRGADAYFSSIGTAGSFNANTLSASMAYLSSISTTSITLDGNTLDTAGSGFGSELLLNGVPIATTSNISSIGDWAYEPAISTINANNNDIISANNVGCVNLTATNSIAGVIGGFTTLNSGNITNTSNILTNTLQTTGLLQAASISTPSLKANLISTGTINVSTLLGVNAAIGGVSTNTLSTATIQTGSIAANSGNYSTITVSTITAGSVVFPVEPNLVVSSITVDGATTTQSLSVTSGATFAGTRPNFTTGINTSGANNFNNNNLDNVGRITANTVFIGSSNYINTQTSSFTTFLNDRGADVGGNSVINLTAQYGAATRVNITAGQASAYAPTPTQIVTITANGSTSLTNNPVGGRVSLVANAGSGSACNILGFGQVDITANSSLPFAGLIKESAGSILAYSGATSPLVGVYGYSYYSALNCLSLTAGATPPSGSYPGVVYLRGDSGTKVVNGFFSDTITATGDSVLPTITTNGLTAFTGSSLAFVAPTQNIQFNSATVGFNARIAGDFSVSSITNVSSINGAAYPPSGGGAVSSFTNLYATNASTTNLLVSSINNAAYPPASGGSWVSTATNYLNMNGNPITDLAGNLRLNVSSGAIYSAVSITPTSIDLFSGGAGNYIRRNADGNIIDTTTANIQTQAISTINTVNQTIFTGGVSRTLVGSNVQQPILQYGFASSIGASGTVTVTIPQRYTSQTSYIPFANMIDSPAAQLFVSSITRGSFIIGWTSAGVGNQTFGWQTMGT